MGYTPDELRGKPFFDYVYPSDVERAVTAFSAVRGGEQVRNLDVRVRCKSGEYEWMAWNAVASPADACFYAIGRIITDRKRPSVGGSAKDRFDAECRDERSRCI